MFPGIGTRPVFDTDNDKIILKEYIDTLTKNYKIILDEYIKNKNIESDYILNQDEHKLNNGVWKWNSYILKGEKQSKFLIDYPETYKILESFTKKPKLMINIPFSYAFISILKKNSKIAAHYGPCNLRIRCHFPLVIPEGDCGMEIGGKTVKWEVGKPLFFDDCYEHKVWNNTEEDRVVLLFDIWHPEIEDVEVDAITDMFDHAKDQGWLRKGGDNHVGK